MAVGFLLAVAAACCYDSGYALQALEARGSPPERSMRPSLLGHLVRRPVWLAAIGLSLLGWVLQLVALAHAPLTLVQPVLALGLFLLLGLAVIVLGERVGRREWLGVALIVAAVAVIAWAAPGEGGEVPRGAGLAAALALLGGLTLIPFAVSVRSVPPVALLVIGAGAADGLAAFVSKIVSQEVEAGRWLAAAVWAAGAGAAILAGLISETSALQRAAATRVAPAVLVLQIAIPVVLAPLVGGESWAATPLGGAVLGGALGLLALGVVALAGSRSVADLLAEDGAARGSDQAAASSVTTLAAAGRSANE